MDQTLLFCCNPPLLAATNYSITGQDSVSEGKAIACGRLFSLARRLTFRFAVLRQGSFSRRCLAERKAPLAASDQAHVVSSPPGSRSHTCSDECQRLRPIEEPNARTGRLALTTQSPDTLSPPSTSAGQQLRSAQPTDGERAAHQSVASTTSAQVNTTMHPRH